MTPYELEQKKIAELSGGKGFASLTSSQKESLYGQTITSELLAPATPITLPKPPASNITDQNAAVAGAIAGAAYTTPSGAVVSASGEVVTPPPTPAPTPAPAPVEKSLPDRIKELFGGTEPPTPPAPIDYVAQQKQLEEQAGLKEKETSLQNLNAQLASLQAEQQRLQMQEQYIPEMMQEKAKGRGITKAGLAPLTAAELRKNALAMLPITQQILGISAQLAAAKGNYDMAVNNIDKMLNLQAKTRKEQFDYWDKLYENAKLVATEEQKERLEAKQAEARNAEIEAERFDDLKSTYIDMAKDNQDFAAAAKMATLEMGDESKLQELAGGITKKAEKIPTPPSSYQEWELAGGQQGTGMSYANWLTRKDKGDGEDLISDEVIADYAWRLDAGEITLSNIPDKLRNRVLEKSIQAKQPRDFADDEIRTLVNEDKTAGGSYEDIISAIDTFPQLKNKDRAKQIADEIFGKKKESEGEMFGAFTSFFGRLFGK